jgi:hypothetical protein
MVVCLALGQPNTTAPAETVKSEVVSIADIEGAERLVGIAYTAAEREQMVGNFEGQIASAVARRKLRFDNSLPTATRFDPRLPNFRMPAPGSPRFSRTAVRPLPADEADIAFASIGDLAAWIGAGALTSRRLTEIYLSRIDALGPKLVWAAVHRDRWQDGASSSAALIGVSLPDFFWGIMLILLFARTLGWFPSSGFADPSVSLEQALSHAFLPSLALGLGLMAHLTRMTRSTMTGILGQEFIRVGRAKGLKERTIVWRYALANAIGPLITVAGLQVGYLFGSIIVIETLFNYTGMGWLTYQALLNRDIPLIQATVFVIAAVVMLANLAVDLLYMLFDPRIRLA